MQANKKDSKLIDKMFAKVPKGQYLETTINGYKMFQYEAHPLASVVGGVLS